MQKIFLEKWLHEKIRQRWEKDAEYVQFIGERGPGKEITRADIENFQLFKLKNILAYVYKNSSFYKELFDEHAVKPSDIQSLADLRKLPFTEPSDIVNIQIDFSVSLIPKSPG